MTSQGLLGNAFLTLDDSNGFVLHFQEILLSSKTFMMIRNYAKQEEGFSIIATINQGTYETKRPIEESYESEKSRRIVSDDELPKWNDLIRCS